MILSFIIAWWFMLQCGDCLHHKSNFIAGVYYVLGVLWARIAANDMIEMNKENEDG